MKAFHFPTLGACEVIATESPRTSLLDHCFNRIWAKALDMRDQLDCTDLAIIHSDIGTDPGWLDILHKERGDADMCSAVVPIKNSCGLTSTALNTGDLWLPRRLVMKEVMAMPETFASEDVGYPLLLNTGLCVINLTRPWADQVCFDSLKRIVKKQDGTRVAQCVSEDWFFSNALNELGCKLVATRKVTVAHHGEREFTNNHPWGLWKTDDTYADAHASAEAKRDELCASSS
jgi:hypothetical protein